MSINLFSSGNKGKQTILVIKFYINGTQSSATHKKTNLAAHPEQKIHFHSAAQARDTQAQVHLCAVRLQLFQKLSRATPSPPATPTTERTCSWQHATLGQPGINIRLSNSCTVGSPTLNLVHDISDSDSNFDVKETLRGDPNV